LIRSGEATFPRVEFDEPLLLECQEFIKCMRERRRPLSGAKLALKVVETLETAQRLIETE